MSLGLTDKLKKAPKIKSITVTEEKALLLCWSKVEGAEKYVVRRSTDPSGKFEDIAKVKTTEYKDDTAEENVTYWYRVVATKKLEGKKTSKKASAVRAFVMSDIPAPQNISISSGKKAEIKILWSVPKDMDGCIVSRRNDFHRELLPVAKVEGKSYKDEAIVSGQPYHYAFQYYKTDGDRVIHGNFSEELDYIYLGSGKILSAKKGVLGKVRFSLRLVAGADGYILYRSEEEKGEYTEVARNENGLDLRLTDKKPSMMKKLYYRVGTYKIMEGKEYKSAMSDIVKL